MFKLVAPCNLLLNELLCCKRNFQLFRMGQSWLQEACGKQMLKCMQKGSGGNQWRQTAQEKRLPAAARRKWIGFKQQFFHLFPFADISKQLIFPSCQWAGRPLSSKPRGGPGACKVQLKTPEVRHGTGQGLTDTFRVVLPHTGDL